MGFENEVEQSFGRPCRQTNGRSKRTCELTSSIVPRGTSFHRSVELECPSNRSNIEVEDDPLNYSAFFSPWQLWRGPPTMSAAGQRPPRR
jgi:hypothetical protein